MNVGQLASRTFSSDANGTLQEVVGNTQVGIVPGAANPLFPQVVNLQAFYGKDTDNDRVVDTYDAVTPTTPAGWAQVLTVRIAVVTRSTQYEKDEVTASEPLWDVG